MVGRVYRKIKTTIFKLLFPRFKSAVLYEVPRIYFKNRLTLGEKVHINDNVFINAVGTVSIGNYNVLSHGVTIVSTGLETSKWVRRVEDEDNHIDKPIVIGDNVWIGTNATICAGVMIAPNTIIAAGAVVNKNLTEEYCIYGGVPAKKIKELK
ncbi:acyltransferase [Faecalibaculum rodentium]|jgi:acetyltransferase-like isoleucine patch superfamily enzyme|uniref:acyltransferase n=1 Tax=Faecalibaculum rodentium TaxID=1702221 RepID=UPI0025B26BAC|nr:acyltransferase [Faecalibaculum rodentium]